MANITRRLSAEERAEIQVHSATSVLEDDLLHDLDVADREIAEHERIGINAVQRQAELIQERDRLREEVDNLNRERQEHGCFEPWMVIEDSRVDLEFQDGEHTRFLTHQTEYDEDAGLTLSQWWEATTEHPELATLRADLAAAQATIAQLQRDLDLVNSQLAEQLEDKQALIEADYKAISGRDAVIAAMREMAGRLEHTGPCEYNRDQNLADCQCGIAELIAVPSKDLAADHDAAVRADERRKVLEEVKGVALENWDIDTAQEIECRIEQLAAQPEEATNE